MAKKSLIDREVEFFSSISSVAPTVTPTGAPAPAAPTTSVLAGSESAPAPTGLGLQLSNHIQGEVLVKLNAGLSETGRAHGLEQAALAIRGQVAELVHVVNPGDPSEALVARLTLGKGMEIEQAIQVLSKLPEVEVAEPNWVYSTQAISNDSYYTNGSLWGMYSDTADTGSTSNTLSNSFGSQANEAWSVGLTGSLKTVVGVIDTGIDYTHPDLYLNIWLNQAEIKSLSFYGSLKDVDTDGLITFRDLNDSQNKNSAALSSKYLFDWNKNGRIDAGDLLNNSSGWENGRDDDGNGRIDDLIGWDFANSDNDPMDDNNHGSHVSGTIGGIGGNGSGVAGVNWNVQLMALKFLDRNGSGSTTGAINAVNYYTAAASKPATSENFVATNNSWGGGGFSQTLLDAIINGAKKDLLFVAAAGNSSSNNDAVDSYPANYNTESLAGFDAVVSVAAIDSSGSLASFSQYGANTVDLGAPGVGIWSTVRGGSYASYNGTSMATPHVTGALALLASADPSLAAINLKSLLLSTAAVTPSLAGKTVSGGRLDVGALISGLNTSPQPNDTVAPSLSISLADSQLTYGETTTVTFTFSEIVQGFDLSDIDLTNTNGRLGVLSTADYKTYTSMFTPTSGVNDLTNTISVANGLFFDQANNSGIGATSSNFTVDTTTPQVQTIWGTTGSDTITGTSGADRLAGVPSTGTSIGKGSIDKFYGLGGADIFLLGDGRGRFYDDGSARNSGTGDYGYILDFSSTEGDKIQLRGVWSEYFLRDVSSTNKTWLGAGIFYDSNANKTYDSSDELIGIIGGISPATLQQSDFTFV